MPSEYCRAGMLLTAKQTEILLLLAIGKTNIEIGMILSKSALTVKNQVQDICVKLNAANRTHAVYRGFETGLIKLKETA